MHQDRHAEMKAKQQRMQEEVRRKNARSLIKREIDFLENSHCSYVVYYEHQHFDWMASHLPLKKKDGYHGEYDFQIDVSETPELLATYTTDSKEEFWRKFNEYVCLLGSQSDNIITYRDGGDPELELPLAQLLVQPSLFFNTSDEWAISGNKSWIIEKMVYDKTVIRYIDLKGNEPILKYQLLFTSNPDNYSVFDEEE